VITCATRSKDGGLFLVPESKQAVHTLVNAWSTWGPSVFPGARITSPAVYSHIQLDDISHAAAPELKDLAAELMERYLDLGPVLGSPLLYYFAEFSPAVTCGPQIRTWVLVNPPGRP
jgi:hypothetical protein